MLFLYRLDLEKARDTGSSGIALGASNSINVKSCSASDSAANDKFKTFIASAHALADIPCFSSPAPFTRLAQISFRNV